MTAGPSRMYRVQVLALFGLCLVSVACAPGAGTVNDQTVIPKRLLSFPPAVYLSLAYVNDRLIAFTFPKPHPPAIAFAYEGGQQLFPFEPMPDPTCTRYLRYYVMGHVLPDGRLGLLKDCGGAAPGNVASVFAYDWQTQQLTRLVREDLSGGPYHEFTGNPQVTRGVQEMGSGLQGTIFWIDANGPSPMDVEIEDQGLTWNLGDYYEGKRGGVGFAESPAWSPDGKTIAFFASPYGIRETPVDRLNVQSELYFMDPSTLRPVRMLQAIANARYVRWSPDSKRVAFFGCIGWQVECGAWLYDIDGKLLTLVDSGSYFNDITWIGNTKLAAIREDTVPTEANQVWEYALPSPIVP